MDTSIRLCTMDGLPELRNLSINTFYETFAPMNTAEDMENYLATSFDEANSATVTRIFSSFIPVRNLLATLS